MWYAWICAAAIFPQLEANAGSRLFRVEMQLIEWKSPENQKQPFDSSIPANSKIVASVKTTAEIGREFSADATFGTSTLAMSGKLLELKKGKLVISISGIHPDTDPNGTGTQSVETHLEIDLGVRCEICALRECGRTRLLVEKAERLDAAK